MPSYEEIQSEAIRVLEELRRSPVCPLEKRMSWLPLNAGVYGLRRLSGEFLYIGIAQNIRQRFAGGHKAISWAYIDRIPVEEIGLCWVVVNRPWKGVLKELEPVILRSERPPYNAQIRREF